jgi:hypothetical protein
MRCGKCREKELSDKKFTTSELSILPYNGTETLTFKDSIGDSVCYYGQGRKDEMDITHEAEYPNDAGCYDGGYRQVESVSVDFHHNPDTTFNIRLFFYHPFGDMENDKYIDFTFSGGVFACPYSFEAGTIMKPKLSGWNDFYVAAIYNSLTLVNKTYSNVYELKRYHVANYPQMLTSVYYSISKGIVGFKKKSGETWYLD